MTNAKRRAQEAAGEAWNAFQDYLSREGSEHIKRDISMTNETEYGPEIVVDGVRPEWLRDGEMCKGRGVRACASWFDWTLLKAIRLRPVHPYYQVSAHNAKHGTQFKYWPGGDEAPGDCAGGVVLFANGRTCELDDWERPINWKWLFAPAANNDIIGYTPKPCAPHPLGQPDHRANRGTPPMTNHPAAIAERERIVAWLSDARNACAVLSDFATYRKDGHPTAKTQENRGIVFMAFHAAVAAIERRDHITQSGE